MRVTTNPLGDTVGFDGLRAVVGVGEGVVGRFPGIVCVARCPDPGPLREFLALCASVGGADPGRALARRLATWMSGPTAPGPELRFGTVAAAGDQLAVFLVGAVEASVEGPDGLTLSGAHAAIGTDRLFPLPRTPVMLSLDGGQVRADPADVSDLRAGVVPGAGVVLHPATVDRDERDAGEGAGLAGHEWFEAADLASDPLGDRPSWLSPDVPAQRMGGRNGSTHAPGAAEDDGLDDAATGPERGTGVSATNPDLGPQAFDEGDAGPDLGPRDFDGEDAGPDLGPRAFDEEVAEPDLGPRAFDEEDADPVNGGHGGRHALIASADPATADPSAPIPDGRSIDDVDADPQADDPDVADSRPADPGAVDSRPADPYPADPRAAESGGAPGPGDAEADDRSAGSRAPDLRALDPRTGDPPGDLTADKGADPRRSDLRAGDSGSADRLDGIPIGDGGRSQLGDDPWAPEAPSAESDRSDRVDPWGAEDHDVDGHVDLFAEQAPVEQSPADRAPAEPPPPDKPADKPRSAGSPATSADASAEPQSSRKASASALFASAPPRSDPSLLDPPGVDPSPAADDAASVERAAPAASRRPWSAAGEPPVDLFAVGPRSDSHPPRADPGAGRKRPEPAARIRDAGPAGAGRDVGAPSPSAAEATWTMPGLLFHPGGDTAGDTTGADLASVTAFPDVRPAPADPVAPEQAPGGARIRGYRCENGHLNDPRSPTCRHCGATIDERAGGLVAGPRPPLGRLLFDDGAAHVVDGGYLVGRMPEVDDRVRTGELRPIVVEDRAGAVSRVHAEIRVSGWDVIVVDTGSRNGTYICGPNEGTWTALPPRRSRRLLPGARVRMGARMFVFESSSTVR